MKCLGKRRVGGKGRSRNGGRTERRESNMTVEVYKRRRKGEREKNESNGEM